MKTKVILLVIFVMALAACGTSEPTQIVVVPTATALDVPSVESTPAPELTNTPKQAGSSSPTPVYGTNLVSLWDPERPEYRSVFLETEGGNIIAVPVDLLKYERIITDLVGEDNAVLRVMYYDSSEEQNRIATILEGKHNKIWFKNNHVYTCNTCKGEYILHPGSQFDKVIEKMQQMGEIERAKNLVFWRDKIDKGNACVPSLAKFAVIYFCERGEGLPLIPTITPTITPTPTGTGG